MNCERVRELLSPHLDDQVVDAERDELRRHLEECAGCREHFDGMSQVVSLIRGIPAVDAPAGFRDEIVRGLPPRSPVKSRLLQLIPRVAAAILLVSFGCLGAMHFLPDSGLPPVDQGLLVGDSEESVLRDSTRTRSPDVTSSEAGAAGSAPDSAPAALPPKEPFPSGATGKVIGVGGGAGGAFREAPADVLIAGTREVDKVERSLEYVVSGGKPDATAGLILAELQNRRSRVTGAEARDASYDDGLSSGMEEVVQDSKGEPARLVLYLTADEVQYILTLLLKRNGSTTVSHRRADLEGDGAESSLRPEKPKPALLGEPDLARAKERAQPEEEEFEQPPHRFRVELRFDR